VLSVLWRIWRVAVVYFAIDVIQDWNVICPVLCYLCYRGLGGLGVQYFVFYVIEGLKS
jgi:hypothetical protein